MSDSPPDLPTLTNLIHDWGCARAIHANSSPIAQARKCLEEVNELIEAAAQLALIEELNDDMRVPAEVVKDRRKEIKHDLTDAIGDVYVTLVQIAACTGVTLEPCVQQAYNEIKDRKGYLSPDGIFIKET